MLVVKLFKHTYKSDDAENKLTGTRRTFALMHVLFFVLIYIYKEMVLIYI